MWTHPDFEAVAALFSARTGIHIPADRRSYVEAGIRRVMRRVGAESISALRARVESEAGAVDELVRELAGGGVLITGPSDPSLVNITSLDPIVTPEGVFYRRKEPAAIRVPVELTRDKLSLDRDVAAMHVRALGNVDPEAAMRACAQAVEAFPLAAELRYLHATLLLASGDEIHAEQSVRRALYLDRSLGVAHALLGTILKRRGDLEAARRSFRSAWRTCAAMPADAQVPLGEGERAGIFRSAVASELALLAEHEQAGR